eukprot:scaffold87105_cov80-Phaeocystis_antarctica.AAC.3
MDWWSVITWCTLSISVASPSDAIRSWARSGGAESGSNGACSASSSSTSGTSKPSAGRMICERVASSKA